MKIFYQFSLSMALSFLMWISNDHCFATGSSNATIQILPITYNNFGGLLCKTRYRVNPLGITGLTKTEYGWLIVSTHGIWEEYPYLMLDPDQFQDDVQTMIKTFEQYDREFNTPFNWASPPTSVQPLLKKYGFQEQTLHQEFDKENVLLSIKNMVRTCDECEKRQRTLHNLTAAITEDTKLEIVFYHAGIVLLKNIHDDSQHIGEVFDIPHFMTLEDKIPRDYGIEMQDIDGILLLPQQ